MTAKNIIGCLAGKGSQIASMQLACFVVFCFFGNTAVVVSQDGFDQQFRSTVVPFLKTYCHECHSGNVVAAVMKMVIAADQFHVNLFLEN